VYDYHSIIIIDTCRSQTVNVHEIEATHGNQNGKRVEILKISNHFHLATFCGM